MSSEANHQVAQSKPVGIRLYQNAIVACLVITAATIFAYWPVVHADFINYDDPDYVSNNPRVQDGLTWKGAKWAFTTRHASNWHPVTWLSHMLDAELTGKEPRGPHVTNLILHSINAMLLYFVLRRMTKSHWRSAMVAMLFALHPLHVESVAWIAERKDVLSTCFGLLTLLVYANWTFGRQPGDETERSGMMSYLIALGLFALGLMTKPMLVTLPFLLLLLDFWPLRRMDIPVGHWLPRLPLKLVVEKTPFFVLSIASCVVTTWAQQRAIQPFEHLPLASRIFNAGVTYLRYLGKMVWPESLALPYLHPGRWSVGMIVFAVIIIIILCFVAVTMARKLPYVLVGWCWYLGTLVPVIGILQVGIQSMADRYTYFSLVGVFIVFAWGIHDWLQQSVSRRNPTIFLIFLFCGILGVLTHRQAKHWKNGETLFKHSAAVTHDNFIALGNVGGALFEAGRIDEAMDYYQRAYSANPNFPETINSIGAVLASRDDSSAIEWFKRTLELQPDHADALFNMGNACAKKHDYDKAAQYYERALKERPDNYEARNNLGNNLFKLKRIDDAIAQYRTALDYKPDAALIHKNLGEALAAKGKLDEAIVQYRKALSQTNDAGTHYSLAMTLAVQDKWPEAIDHYLATIQLSPTNADAHYNLGYALRVHGNLAAAQHHLSEALRLKPNFPLAQFNLACVLADQHQTVEAMDLLREALRLKPDYDDARNKLETLQDH